MSLQKEIGWPRNDDSIEATCTLQSLCQTLDRIYRMARATRRYGYCCGEGSRADLGVSGSKQAWIKCIHAGISPAPRNDGSSEEEHRTP